MHCQLNPVRLPQKIEAGIYLINKAASIVASFVLAAMMLLTISDIVGRYFLSKPIRGTWEIVGLLLVCTGTWGWGYCQMKKEHIMVSVIINRLSHKLQVIIGSLNYFIGFAVFSLLCWRMYIRAIKYISLPTGSGLTETLEIPLYPFMFMLMISAGLMALVFLIDLLHSLVEVTHK